MDLARDLDIDADAGAKVNDSELMTMLLAADIDLSTEEAIARVAPRLKGAFSVVACDEERLYAFRDHHGVRPLVIGRLPKGGWVVASETAALDIVGASSCARWRRARSSRSTSKGLSSTRVRRARPALLPLRVGLPRPSRPPPGRPLGAGRAPGDGAPARPGGARPTPTSSSRCPDSGRDAAAGYAAESGLEYADGLVKNRYVGRTFIEPSQSLRELGIRLKLSPCARSSRTVAVVVVDDSIVRGNTSRQLVAMLRAAGAAEVHLRISSPPIEHPCYYGIDMASRSHLIAADMEVEDIRQFIGADSLHYISLEGLTDCTPVASERLCRACFDGRYPIPVPGEQMDLAAGGEARKEREVRVQ